ncbi:hypothetical protein DAHU10_042610 [Hanseniaspora uvarum]|nr:hypothetical protein DAHU10_042610 [Hanseniaspora uvarum]
MLPYSLNVKLQFANSKDIDIVLQSSILTDDLLNIETTKNADIVGDINKFYIQYNVSDTILDLNFHSLDVKALRLNVNNIIENIKLSVEVLDNFI